MHEQGLVASLSLDTLSPAVHDIVRHLCEGECHTYGSVLQWCESRGDCTYAVVCPTCSTQYLIDEDDLAALERWTTAQGDAIVCGIRS